jgi:bis(5'-nucleosyl)-tetraphosphatase (symmetrical)
VATYAIGDLQGCYDELQRLLEQLDFDETRDQLWFVGDLVNRGPKSLDALRFVKSLGAAAVTVLGNHDLHLLALAHGNPRHKNSSNLNGVLAAPDRDELIHWLRHRPLLHRDKNLAFTMVHAGLAPQWSMKTARACAHEVENVLQSDQHVEYFLHMYGNEPRRWDEDLEGMERWRFITNCFTRLRYCSPDGSLQLQLKGAPNCNEPKQIPWFAHPQRASRKKRILFGHWSTLGYQTSHNTWALDSGCLWGGLLTALRIDPYALQLPCPGQQSPAKFS